MISQIASALPGDARWCRTYADGVRGPTWYSQGEPHLPLGLTWLSPAERAHHDRMRYSKRRVEFLVARWTAKQAVVLAQGRPPDEVPWETVEIGHAPDGAPIPHIDGQPWDRRLSMTDRAGWAVTVVSPDRTEVGCDLELVEPRTPAFVADWFTPTEQQYVAAAHEDDERSLRANLVWSAKESALKVLRTGLRRDTRSVEVWCAEQRREDDDGRATWSPLTVTAVEGRTFPGWWCRFGDFILTFAAADAMPAPVAQVDPPALASARPIHSWLDAPLAPGSGCES